MRALKMTLGGIALGWALAAASGAAASQTLNFSYASTGVGSCDLHVTGCGPTHLPVYTQQTLQFGNMMNAASSAADPAWGASDASANLAAGALNLPQLHSDVSGFPSGPGVPYSWNYSQVQGVMSFTATSAITIDLHDFIGALQYSNTGTGVGLVSASLAIIGNGARDFAVGNSYYAQDAAYGFANTCSAPAALAIGETGNIFTKGTNLALTVAPTICGASTVSLAAGEGFALWARMQTFEDASETVDASHSFTVQLAPGLSADVVANLTQNLIQYIPVPEPATWAMLVIGLGGAGSVLRTRRRKLASPRA